MGEIGWCLWCHDIPPYPEGGDHSGKHNRNG